MSQSSMMSFDVKEEVAQRWIEMVLGEKLCKPLPQLLEDDGIVLCQLIAKLYFALGLKHMHCVAHKIDPSADLATKQDASCRNLQEYLKACEYLGVSSDDMFDPVDAINHRQLDRVYKNILALQAAATAISSRRSIDERSFVDSNASSPSSFSVPSRFTPRATTTPATGSLDTLSPFGGDLVNGLEHDSKDPIRTAEELHEAAWKQILDEYEQFLLRKHQLLQENSRTRDHHVLKTISQSILSTEENIRALLLQEDGTNYGVPQNLHARLWLLASGAAMEKKKHPSGFYESLLAMEQDSTEATRQIDVDLHRTISEPDKRDWNESKTQMMRRILLAYSFFNPMLGYCQGLNYIVARILQFVENEDDAFFLLVKMIELVPDDYYTNMFGLAVDQHVFRDLVRLRFPEIATHLMDLGGSSMDLSLASMEWFLTLFASPCVKEITVSVWDYFFLLGDEVLFRVALALLETARSKLLASDNMGDIRKLLNESGHCTLDPSDLMRSARCQDCVVRSRIDDFRAHHRLQCATGIAMDYVSTDEDDHSPQATEQGVPHLGSKQKRDSGNSHGNHHRRRMFHRAMQPRFCRTFDNHLTEEYTEQIRREDPNMTTCYDDLPPKFIEEYWGSSMSRLEWGQVNFKYFLVTTSPPGEQATTMNRLADHHTMVPQSEMQLLTQGNMEMPMMPMISARHTHSVHVKGDTSREKRSKSTSHHLRRGHSARPATRVGPLSDEQLLHPGKSPIGWIQRIEDWHKEMKMQKEKKKAEKTRHKQQQIQLLFQQQQQQQLQLLEAAQHGAQDHHADHHDVSRGSHSNRHPAHHHGVQRIHRRSSNTCKTFLPTSPIRARPHSEILTQKSLLDELENFSGERAVLTDGPPHVIRDHFVVQGNQSDAATVAVAAAAVDESDEDLLPQDLPGTDADESASTKRADGTSKSPDQPPLRLFTSSPPTMGGTGFNSMVKLADGATGLTSVHSFSTPALNHLDHNSSESDGMYRRSEDLSGSCPWSITALAQHDTIDTMAPAQEDGAANMRSFASFVMRHEARTPIARSIRERAHVVSYLQRKASDCSNLSGSYCRTPQGHKRSSYERSISSSEESHLNELNCASPSVMDQEDAGSARANATVNGAASGERVDNLEPASALDSEQLSPLYRSNSVSFLEKLSFDVERSLDELFLEQKAASRPVL